MAAVPVSGGVSGRADRLLEIHGNETGCEASGHASTPPSTQSPSCHVIGARWWGSATCELWLLRGTRPALCTRVPWRHGWCPEEAGDHAALSLLMLPLCIGLVRGRHKVLRHSPRPLSCPTPLTSSAKYVSLSSAISEGSRTAWCAGRPSTGAGKNGICPFCPLPRARARVGACCCTGLLRVLRDHSELEQAHQVQLPRGAA